MEAWISILHESQLFPTGYCKEAAAAIFKTYLEVHLAAPDGARPRGSSEDDEECEDEEVDRVKYKDTLSTVGALGRECLDYSLPALINLLESRYSLVFMILEHLQKKGAFYLVSPRFHQKKIIL